MSQFTPFDAADYLDDETIVAYLNAALEEEDPDAFLCALKTVARARGMTQQLMSKNSTCLSRQG
jgi:probable addiction module antidote protein